MHHRLSSPQPEISPPLDAERCEACDVVRSGVPCDVGTSLAGAEATVDSDVVVIRGPHITGLLVIPCQHVGGLEELLPPARRPTCLRPIRRAVTAVAAGSALRPPGSRVDRVAGIIDSPVLLRSCRRTRSFLRDLAVASWDFASLPHFLTTPRNGCRRRAHAPFDIHR